MALKPKWLVTSKSTSPSTLIRSCRCGWQTEHAMERDNRRDESPNGRGPLQGPVRHLRFCYLFLLTFSRICSSPSDDAQLSLNLSCSGFVVHLMTMMFTGTETIYPHSSLPFLGVCLLSPVRERFSVVSNQMVKWELFDDYYLNSISNLHRTDPMVSGVKFNGKVSSLFFFSPLYILALCADVGRCAADIFCVNQSYFCKEFKPGPLKTRAHFVKLEAKFKKASNSLTIRVRTATL